ncbi:hypothetical protein N7533_007013 [Penicillium manginii]|uniref:uncharacterized protein n=1 Tax=Penicillium manginii TaxID=203109 RepID=UPI002547FF7B|nr:uncharacterized protein N7533_007013 [Penicillium manginii]KAJ5749985.1 hypothetical protein N7533_007013 [Penicillium manginii]
MDGQQRAYIPGPPTLPPPPPRHPHQHPQLQQPGVPPPPPGPPPGTSYAVPSGWQPNYARQALAPGFPPPPPPPPQQQNPLVGYRLPAPLSIDNQPLTSATYIPGHDTIGVGIPPLFEPGRTGYDASYPQQRPVAKQTYDYPTTTNNGTHPGGMNVPPHLHGTVHEIQSNENLQQNQSPGVELAKSPSHRHNTSGASLGGLSPSEAAIYWPLDRVLMWLAKMGFSNDWQETFKSLELQGADFLELGLAWGGRGNLGKIHKVVYPQLAKECARSGTGWDSTREREEGLRLRKLIRSINDGNPDSSISTPLRQEPPAFPLSSTDTGTTFHPAQISEPRSAGPTPGVNDISPGQLAELHASTQSQKQGPHLRSVTQPLPAGYESPKYESPIREHSTLQRSEYSRNTLAQMNDHKRQSPSLSSDHGTFSGSSRRPQDSPKSGSPALQYASPSYQGLTSTSTGDLTLGRYEHSRGNSADSTGRGNGNVGRYYDNRRQGHEGARPSPQETNSRPWSGETPTSYREHNKGFLNMFKRKARANEYPSPEEQHSPSSPEPRPNGSGGSYTPYSKPGFNISDMSLGDRPSSSATKVKRWVFATTDGLNYRLIDVSDMESVEALRAGICKDLGLNDWASAQIFLTEPGQHHHDDPMSDTMLAVSRRNKSDAYGSLKLFVQANSSHPAIPYGLGVSIPHDKAASSPTTLTHPVIPRKPLEPEALDRISPQATAKPASPFPAPGQSTSKPSVTKTTPDSTESATLLDAEQTDLHSRHEAHLREVERKQREHRVSRVPPNSQPGFTGTYGETGYRRTGIIDFNTPRISPYEEKKEELQQEQQLQLQLQQQQEGLVPRRNPPVAPNESNTLTKVNSLRKGPGDRPIRAQPGLGAALANMGRMTSSIGTPSPSVPVPPTPSSINQDSTGSDSDRPQTLDSAASASSKTTLESSRTGPKFFSEQDSERTPSPRSTSKSSQPSRKSVGPEFEFEESEVSFARTHFSNEDSDESDDDSDDGLFAIRPSRTEPEETEPEKKPTLTVDTHNNKRRTVTIQSPKSAAKSSSYFMPSSYSSGGEASDNPDQCSGGSHGTASPANERLPRRESFASDLWASRPPVEGVIDNLDSFFPNVDLDAPYLEEPPSPNNKMNGDNDATLRGKPQIPQTPSIPQAGSDASTVRPTSVAVRNINRSGGGLSRTKSIRQVAQGAHRTKSIGPATGPRKSGDLLRRKSTKMFGHKIMQISPKPGTRLSQLDPIPQHTSSPGPVEAVPQRQQTFRIIRGQLIGKGTYGRVYLGINADNGEVLAVKQVEINARIAGNDRDRIKEMVAALDQEIDTMQHLEHPNIVQYLGCERGDLSISIYLEYISGGSIGSCLRKHGKFEESVVKSLTRQTLGGLAYLHDMGILHRDLKADNILLDVDGTCKISDFGISKKTDDIYGNDSSNSMQGTVFWMAPEVIQSQGQGYSAKVDIWSLGCVVLEMFAGRRPWSKEEAIGAIFKLGSLGQAPPIPEDVSVSISPAALAFMYDCFTVNSSERPTAGTLLTRHPFCESDPNYNFLETELYAKIRDVY